MTISGDKHLELLSGPFPAVENLLVLEGMHRINLNVGSGHKRPQPRIVGPAGPAPRFALLPQPKSRWREFACSLFTQTAGLLLLSLVSVFAPKALPVREYQAISLLAPRPLSLHPDPAPMPPPAVKPPRPKIEVSERLVHLRGT